MCWTASSSSEVEQTFSKIERCHLYRGKGHHDVFRRAVVGLTSDHGNNLQTDADLFAQARQFFVSGENYSSKNLRAGRKHRLDKGTHIKQMSDGKAKAQSEAAWLRKRKDSVAKAVEETTPKQTISQQECSRPDGFTLKMLQESKQMKDATLKGKVEAMLDGYLHEDEEPTPKQVTRVLKKNEKYDKKRLTEEEQAAQLWRMVQDKKNKSSFLYNLQGKILGFPAPMTWKNKHSSTWDAILSAKVYPMEKFSLRWALLLN